MKYPGYRFTPGIVGLLNLVRWAAILLSGAKLPLLYTLLFMSEKRGGNWVTLFGGMDFDKSSGLEPELDGDPPG
jgi:hypothetical protein